MSSDKRTNKAIEQKRPPTPTLPLRFDPTDETFKAERFPSAWTEEAIAAGKMWKCPKGIYEVYAKLDTSPSHLFLNVHNYLVRYSLAGIWYPSFSNYVVLAFKISGEIGTPGSSDTYLDMIQDQVLSNCNSTPSGWQLSTGETLSASAGSFDVRYRRIA